MRRGLFRVELRDFIERLLTDWQIQEVHKQRALDAVEFQYTHWPDPENNTARSQEFINVGTPAAAAHPQCGSSRRSTSSPTACQLFIGFTIQYRACDLL